MTVPKWVKSWGGTVLKAAVTGVLIWLVLRGVDAEAVAERIATVPLWTLFAAPTLFMLMLVIGTLRWRIILAMLGGKASLGASFRIYIEGHFFNQGLPSTVGGDGIKIYRLCKAGLTLSQSANSVILDRVAGMTSLVLLTAAAQPFFYERVQDIEARAAFTVIFLLAAIGIAALLAIRWLPHGWRRWRAVSAAASLSEGAHSMFLKPRTAMAVLALSTLGHVTNVATFYLIARGLGLDVGFFDCLILIPAVLLLAIVPISIAGWGVRENAMVAAFALVGVEPVGTLAMSILYGLMLIVVGLPGGVTWFLVPGSAKDAAKTQQAAEAAQGEAKSGV